MAKLISNRIQTITPDSIAYSGDVELAIRANGEEITSIIDIAGNTYPAVIPAPVTAPTLNGTAALATALVDGFYAYRYVYAATKRYPLVDAGIGIGGSISPRGNPSPTLVVNPTAGPKSVTINVAYASRLDISEIWIFRSVMYTTSADAQIAGDAGLIFYMGKVVNVPGAGTTTYLDTSKDIATAAQIELDNYGAPTFKYCRYIPPYWWGIGNDDYIVPVTWADDVITLAGYGTDIRTLNMAQWFSGRNGQIATVSGITIGGFDGNGKFLFKVGDKAGNNTVYNAILTKDGITPETLVPATGSGYIKIHGPSATLFRSKPRNPFAWGFTQIFGASRISQIYGLSVGSGRATGIIGLPGDELLKIDLKDPNVCYTFNLKIAAFPEFSSTRKAISKNAISSHFSQFYANAGGRNKVVWGWDADNFAILQCDGTSQVPVTDSLFQTFRKVDSDLTRLRQVHGICDEENQLNVVWLPVRGKSNIADSQIFGTDYLPDGVPKTTDLMVANHYPSNKWSIGYDFDLTCSAAIRDISQNKIKILGGTFGGILGRILDKDANFNFGTTYANPMYGVSAYDVSQAKITLFPGGAFTGLVSPTYVEAQTLFRGLWCSLFRYNDPYVSFFRINFIDGDDIYFDLAITDYRDDLYEGYLFDRVIPDGNLLASFAEYNVILGDIPSLLKKKFNFKAPTKNKKLEKLYIAGHRLEKSLMFLMDYEGQVVRAPTNAAAKSDDITIQIPNLGGNRNVFEFKNISIPYGKEIDLWIFNNNATVPSQLRNIVINPQV